MSEVAAPSAFQANVLQLMPPVVCVECTARDTKGSVEIFCDTCQHRLCGEDCMLSHSIWCTAHTRALGNLFDGYINNYYGFNEAFDRLLTGKSRRVSMETLLAAVKPAVLTKAERDGTVWANNRVCVDVECLFFSLVAQRFSGALENLNSAFFFWRATDLAGRGVRFGGLPANIATPYPCTALSIGDESSATRPEWFSYALDEQIAIDLNAVQYGTRSNTAYLIHLVDQTPHRQAKHDHLLVLRVCASRAWLVQAYVQHYTFDQWCNWAEPLVANPSARAAARLGNRVMMRPLDAHPKFRGILDAATANELAATLLRLTKDTGQAARAADWRALTGIHDETIPLYRISTMRADLNSLRV